MNALYDPTASTFLTGAAARLTQTPDALDAYARVAERVLGLAAPAFTGDDAAIAADAVAMQISHMVAMGSDVFYAKTETRGQRSVTYRDDATVQPIAATLVNQLNLTHGRGVTSGLNPDAWATVTSVRPTARMAGACSALSDIRL